MKRYLNKISGILLLMITAAACNDKQPINDEKKNTSNCSYKQRWIMKDYPNTMKIFADSLVYTVYDTDGKFGDIKDAIPNPMPVWSIGDSLYIQRRRTEIDVYKLDFKCDCQVMTLTSREGYTGYYYREGFDISTCQ
jgi:hypothetical protein